MLKSRSCTPPAMPRFARQSARVKLLAVAACFTMLPFAAANAQTADDDAARNAGASDYALLCAGCHDGALLEAPRRSALALFSPEHIVESLESGIMATQGMPLTRAKKRDVAFFLTGKRLNESATKRVSFDCSASLAVGATLDQPPLWNGWGAGVNNSRHQFSETLLTPDNVGELSLDWAFAFPGATRARSQPLVTPEVVFVGSQEGVVYALDASNGCPIWTYDAEAEVRSAVILDLDAQGRPETLLFGDFAANAHAVDAQTGELRWKTSVHEHRLATITGATAVADGILVVPVSSAEIIAASRNEYSCCSFRGAVVGLSIATGEILWTHFTTPPPQPTSKNRAGTQMQGPSGAPVWSGITIDIKRSLVYATTGENYSSPATNTSDAVIAIDLHSGERRWVQQVTTNDAWNGACSTGGFNCPEEKGPDFDFGAAALLIESKSGRDLLVVGQKSGMVYALDPDADGALVWETRAGSGGTMGGIHYGMSSDGEGLFVGVSDLPTNNPYNVGEGQPGIHRLDLASGAIVWRNLLPNVCPETKFLCFQGISAAVSSSPGLVFAGGLDGMLRAFDAESGAILWETNTVQEFGDINGVRGFGGAIEADGPVIAGGSVYVTSGYEKWGEQPGNMLLVYSIKH
ncbi:MAG: PQQ-binding-like beta-propeller repeat protein [Pseudomonadales bacterium]|nr:PQQ-binding-like beta-propeller repeat protein [Pseudomonadales bacterium]